MRPTGSLDRPEEVAGMALEGLVAQHLRAWIAQRNAEEKLYYWRTKSGTEVDFVMYGPDTFSASEVKHAAKVYATDLRALKTFREDYPEARVAMLYIRQERLEIDGIPVIPCVEFLAGL